MILVIDIGNTTIAFTGIAGDTSAEKESACASDFSVLFEAKLPTESGKDIPRFLREAEELLGQYGIPFLPEKADGRPDEKTDQAEMITGEDKTEEGTFSENLDKAASYLNPDRVQAVAISSVVPADTPAAICLAEKICLIPPVVVTCKSDSGLSFANLAAPERVGTDRIADAAWAAARYPLPAMTADLGTATTINVIGPGFRKESVNDMEVITGQETAAAMEAVTDKEAVPDIEAFTDTEAVFLGGMIGAGVRTSLRALRTGTAQLPELEPRPVPAENLIGRDTDGCMLSSAIVGTAAQIEGLASRVEEQLGSPVTLILTGGNARMVSPWIRRPFIYEPSLASKGAAVIALRELSKK